MRTAKSLFLMLVIFNGLMATTCAQVRPVEDNKRKPMSFQNADFEISLNPSWKRRDTQESFEWEDEKDMQEIVISVLAANEPMSPDLRATTAKRLMEHRKRAINEISEGKAVLSEVQAVEDGERTELIIWGIDKVYGMQVYTSVIVHPTRAVTFAYYKYSPLMTDAAFREKSKELRAGLKVH